MGGARIPHPDLVAEPPTPPYLSSSGGPISGRVPNLTPALPTCLGVGVGEDDESGVPAGNKLVERGKGGEARKTAWGKVRRPFRAPPPPAPLNGCGLLPLQPPGLWSTLSCQASNTRLILLLLCSPSSLFALRGVSSGCLPPNQIS